MGGLYDILEAQRLQQPRFIYEGLYQDPDRFLEKFFLVKKSNY